MSDAKPRHGEAEGADMTPSALARKWCERHCDDNRAAVYPDIPCQCGQITAAISEALEEAEKVVAMWSVKPDRSFHPDIPWEQMNETAKLVAHSAAQQIAAEIRALRKGTET